MLTSTLINTTTTNSLSFQPYANYFHHLTLHLLSGNSSTLSISFSNPKKTDEKMLNNIPLIRKSLPDLFLFDYEYLPGNSTEPVPINITKNQLTIMSFRIGSINDIGGTLSIGIRLLNQTDNLLVIGCISLGKIFSFNIFFSFFYIIYFHLILIFISRIIFQHNCRWRLPKKSCNNTSRSLGKFIKSINDSRAISRPRNMVPINASI